MVDTASNKGGIETGSGGPFTADPISALIAREGLGPSYRAIADGPWREIADRIAVLATASSALMGQREFARSITAYQEALRLAEMGLPAGSPALRALAIGGNNLATGLEEKTDRDAVETKGMVAAAEGGLKYWRLAGTWLEEERAEYRLARSLLQAGDPGGAVNHALRCVEVCAANNAAPFERFFGYAVLAIAHKRNADEASFAASRGQGLGSRLRLHLDLGPGTRLPRDPPLELAAYLDQSGAMMRRW